MPRLMRLISPNPWRDGGIVRAIDDFDGPVADLVQCAPQFRPCIATVSKDMTQPRAGFSDRGEYGRCAVTILNIGSMHDEAEHQSDGVGHDVPLTSGRPSGVDLLARVKAPDTAAFSGLDALTVDDTASRLGPLVLPVRGFPSPA